MYDPTRRNLKVLLHHYSHSDGGKYTVLCPSLYGPLWGISVTVLHRLNPDTAPERPKSKTDKDDGRNRQVDLVEHREDTLTQNLLSLPTGRQRYE